MDKHSSSEIGKNIPQEIIDAANAWLRENQPYPLMAVNFGRYTDDYVFLRSFHSSSPDDQSLIPSYYLLAIDRKTLQVIATEFHVIKPTNPAFPSRVGARPCGDREKYRPIANLRK